MSIGKKSELKPLGYTILKDAIVVPGRWVNSMSPFVAGVYNSQGKIVRDACLYRNYSQVSYLPETPASTDDSVSDSAIFAGYWIDHFGHFLLESLARTWAASINPGLPLLWASPAQPITWQNDICRHLRIADRVRHLDRPTVFKELIVPESGFRVRDWMHPDHARFLGQFERGAPDDQDPPVWLSRRLLNSKRIRNEDRLEAELQRRGWNIISPETLTIDRQLEIVSTARAVAGIEGSALHGLMLLCKVQAPVIMVGRTYFQTFREIAQAKGFTQYDLVGAVGDAVGADGVTLELHAPERTAELIDEIMKQHEAQPDVASGDLPRLTRFQDGVPVAVRRPRSDRPITVGGAARQFLRTVRRSLFRHRSGK